MSNKLHDDFETAVWNRSMTTGLESYTAAIQILLERVVALEEQVAKLEHPPSDKHILSRVATRRPGFPGHNEPCSCDRCVDDREGPGWP